jgi:hypothetical protein
MEHIIMPSEEDDGTKGRLAKKSNCVESNILKHGMFCTFEIEPYRIL